MKKDQKTDFLSTRVRYIPINDIRPNPQQPRRRFDSESLQELAASIAAYGILQPLTVRQQGAVYELVAGERRWRAARIAGLRQVPCLLARVDEEDAALLALPAPVGTGAAVTALCGYPRRRRAGSDRHPRYGRGWARRSDGPAPPGPGWC